MFALVYNETVNWKINKLMEFFKFWTISLIFGKIKLILFFTINKLIAFVKNVVEAKMIK